MRCSKRVAVLAEKAGKNELMRKIEERKDERLKVIDCGEKKRGIGTETTFSRGDYASACMRES